MSTDRLIVQLARNVAPVRPLRGPWLRAVTWTVGALVYLRIIAAVIAASHGVDASWQTPRFLIEQLAALVTGITAAAAALSTVVPGRRGLVVVAPAVCLGAWLTILGVGAFQELRGLPDTAAFFRQTDWGCTAIIIVGAALPGAVLVLMIRRGAPLSPVKTAALGGLAAGSLGNIPVCVFRLAETDLIALLWHCGTALVLAAAAAFAVPRLLRWPAVPIAKDS